MTDANCRENVRLEWERAQIAAPAVRMLVEGEVWPEAVSRAYYAAFYAARALLLSQGLEVRSHHGLVHLLSLHFVKPGVLPANLVRAFSQMQQARGDADYQSALSFDEESARAALTTAEAFQAAIEAHLRAEDWL